MTLSTPVHSGGAGRGLVLLAAHGDGGEGAQGGAGPGRDPALFRLQADLAKRLVPAEVKVARAMRDGEVARALAGPGAGRAVVLPLLFSDGYVLSERIRPAALAAGAVCAPPMIDWPGFAQLVVEGIARRVEGGRTEGVLVVAHGSKRSGASAASARGLAGRLEGRFGPVEAAFLEEAPYAADRLTAAARPLAVVGLFLGSGRHGGEDFGRLVRGAGAPPAAAFTIGDLPELGAFVADEARRRLGS